MTALACIVVPVAHAASAPPAWEATFNTEARYYSWTSNRGFPGTTTASAAGGSGSQLMVPFAFGLNGKPNDDWRTEFLIRSAYYWSKQTSAGMSGQSDGLTDTSLTGTFTYYGIAGIQPFTSLTLNLPTGRSNQQGTAAFSKLDQDVVSTPTFGEGFNAGPTVGANIPIGASMIVSASFGYTYRGPFNREGDVNQIGLLPTGTTRLDPGDVFTANIGFGASLGQNWQVQGSASYSWETTTTLNGDDFYRAGGRYALQAIVTYLWDPMWTSKLSASFQGFARNDVRSPPITGIVPELFNSNSNVTKISFDTTYKTAMFAIGPSVSFVYRDHNAWSPTDFRFLPAKNTWSGGVSAQYTPMQMVSLNANVQRIWLREDANPGILAPNGMPMVRTDAWAITFGATIKN
ncbi:MAG: hypothetical protein JOZ70_03650 [Pseudolabrys sp.]|nr:hypothetical protein [Pseudolabrys sp.]MBV9954325.1 hypothetical protein [Pseudolabrys sp.]